MKTPEEIQKRYWQLRGDKRDIHHKQDETNWDILLKEIQLDAWKQGMMDAIELIGNNEPAILAKLNAKIATTHSLPCRLHT